MERSFPPAWEVRGCLLFFLFFLPFCLFLLEQETCLGTFRGLSHEHCQRLSESPGPLGRAVLAGESHPRQPVPRASLSAAGLECSLYHLLSGALPEPKIAQVGQEFLCGCLYLHSSLGERFVSPKLGEAGAPGSCPLESKGAYT